MAEGDPPLKVVVVAGWRIGGQEVVVELYGEEDNDGGWMEEGLDDDELKEGEEMENKDGESEENKSHEDYLAEVFEGRVHKGKGGGDWFLLSFPKLQAEPYSRHSWQCIFPHSPSWGCLSIVGEKRTHAQGTERNVLT